MPINYSVVAHSSLGRAFFMNERGSNHAGYFVGQFPAGDRFVDSVLFRIQTLLRTQVGVKKKNRSRKVKK